MIIPGILEEKFENVVKKVAIIDEVASRIQIDIADNKLVEGKTFLDIEKVATLKTKSKLELHLMVENPEDYVTKKIDNVFAVCAHVEAKGHRDEFIKRARANGYKVGLVLNPETELSELWPHPHKIDYVQFMTVKPGKQGQEFESEVLEKIIRFKKEYPSLEIQVDGGINKHTIDGVIFAGARNLVVGSEIFKSDYPKQTYLDMEREMTASLNKKRKIEKVAFLGGAAWQPEDAPYQDAFAVAKILSENGYEVVNGGGPGVMRAATLGAHAGGGEALAITYHPNKIKRHYEGVDIENAFDEEVKTLDYFDRTKVMLQATDMHIVFNGSIGTLSELGMTWVSSWIHEPNSKPIVLFGEFWHKYLEFVLENMYLKNGEEHLLKICTKPEEVLEYIKSLE